MQLETNPRFTRPTAAGDPFCVWVSAGIARTSDWTEPLPSRVAQTILLIVWVPQAQEG
jgi:hypothetical protein